MTNKCNQSLLWCPECGSNCFLKSEINGDILSHVLVKLDPECSVNSDNFKISEASLHGTMLEFECTKCGNKDVAIIDYPIHKIILDLNKMGYTTAFSCAGHTPFENSYIAFSRLLETSKKEKLMMAISEKLTYAKYLPLYDMIEYTHTFFDSFSERFINVVLDDDMGTFQIDFKYYNKNSLDEDTDYEDYEKCRALFWEFLSDIIEELKNMEIDALAQSENPKS